MRAILHILVLAIVLMPAAASASLLEVNTDSSGLALEGRDPVAYHTLGKATPGSRDITAVHKGATYRFASSDNRQAFLANPEKYLPAYGGFCAFGTAQGYKVNGDPEVWKIVDGRLYLNFNQGVQRRWERDVPGFISQADRTWPTILGDARR